jgi:outer membrane protein assembly factor BamD (BamD/ComL family)
MGRKQIRRGKYFYFFFACVIATPVLLSGCAHLYEKLVTKPDFEQAEDFTRQGNYHAATVKYEQLIVRYPLMGDRVLFQMGILYTLPQNKHKDYAKALEKFQRLVNNYPQSSYRQQSDIFISLIHEISNSDKKLSTQRKQIDKLEQQVEEFEKKIEQIKEVDMNLKQKKKTFP